MKLERKRNEVVCGGGRAVGHDGYEYGRVVRIGGGDREDRAWSALNAEGEKGNPKRISPRASNRFRYVARTPVSTRPSPPCCWIGDHMCVLSAFSESAPKEKESGPHPALTQRSELFSAAQKRCGEGDRRAGWGFRLKGINGGGEGGRD